MAEYRFEDIAINSTEKKKPVESDKEHYLGLEHLDSGTFKVSRFGSEVAPIGDKLIMKKGDVLFGKRRAYQKKVAIAPFDGIFSAHGMVLRPKEDVIDKNFFPLFIASDYFLDAAIKISVGSLSPTINWRDLKELKFNLPELDEQKKFAEVLWQIVDTMESYKKLLAKTDEMVNCEFIKKNNEWKSNRVRLGDYIQQIRGVSYKPNDLKAEKMEDSVILLRANNITLDTGSLNFKEIQIVSDSKVSEEQLIKENDILMCASSGSLDHVGKTALCNSDSENMTFGAFCKLIRIKDSKLNANYLQTFFTTKEYKNIISNLANGSNINNLKNEHIDELMIPLPSIELQTQFANFVKKSEESKATIQTSLDTLSAVYKKIIAENLGGK